ncbi:BQ2448_4132 [Microbotryum intermedium]|uniref:glutathione-specific gamma-glutamylcyclotransferase n=1 Tax=Microbotryum intermedium TaxID=269621 RepID=A0A238FHD9_9BASI|nr:BQ2448_4132 [Microbotryum intermedium]
MSSTASTPPSSGDSQSTAIFGYGSLIFKPPPYDLESEAGYIKGFKRRFAQNSHDHRGTPDNPGRGRTYRVRSCVGSVTWRLDPSIENEAAETFYLLEPGRIYRIPPSQATEIWAYLDYREKDGYTQRQVVVYGIDAQGKEIVIEHNVSRLRRPIRSSLSIGAAYDRDPLMTQQCRVYVGESDNPSFAGGTPMRELAQKIATAHGPSGPNKEYLYLMTRAVRELGPDAKDEYLQQLEGLVQEFDPEWTNR